MHSGARKIDLLGYLLLTQMTITLEQGDNLAIYGIQRLFSISVASKEAVFYFRLLL